MVILSKDIKDLPPEERIRKLKELEEEKKKELEKRRKELEELEKKAKEEEEQHVKDLQEAEQLIQDSIEDLHDEEAQAFEELEKSKRAPIPEESLENKIEGETPSQSPSQPTYGAMLDEIKEAHNFYEVTNYNVVNMVDNLANKAVYEGLSHHEKESLRNFKSSLDRIAGDESYQDKDNANYLQKMAERINQIDDHLQRHSAYERKLEEDRRKDMDQKNLYR